MAEYLIQSETLDDIADAINQKAGSQGAMTPAQMVTAIDNLPTGGGGITGWEYQKITFTPTEEIGRANTSGGFPATDQYIRNLLPSGWTFARAIYSSGQNIAYGLNDVRLSEWGNITEYSRFNSNIVPEQMTGNKTGSQYSVILSPDCVYQIDVFKVVTSSD